MEIIMWIWGENVSHVEFKRNLSCGIMSLSRNPQIFQKSRRDSHKASFILNTYQY